MADEIDDESASQVVAYALIRQKIADVKKIARVLAVKGGDDFSRVEVGKRDDLCLRKAKALLDVRKHGSHFGIEDAATKDGSHFDLDLGVGPLKGQFGNDAFARFTTSFTLTPGIPLAVATAIRFMPASIAASDSGRPATGR